MKNLPSFKGLKFGSSDSGFLSLVGFAACALLCIICLISVISLNGKISDINQSILSQVYQLQNSTQKISDHLDELGSTVGTVSNTLTESQTSRNIKITKEPTSAATYLGRGGAEDSTQNVPIFSVSAEGQNLTFSILLRHRSLKASDALAVTSIMALGICDYLHTKGIEPWIKWPNDIWVGEKKICGILVENCIRAGMIDFSIVGVGLDLNQTDWPPELPNPVSLKDMTGLSYDTHEELEQLSDALARRSALAAAPGGAAEIIGEFSKVVVRLDR